MCFLGSKMAINEPKMFINFFGGCATRWEKFHSKIHLLRSAEYQHFQFIIQFLGTRKNSMLLVTTCNY